MSSRQEIRLYKGFSTTVAAVYDPPHYAVNPQGRGVWFQRTCCRLLKWLGATAVHESVEAVTYTRLHVDDLRAVLYAQRETIFLATEREARYLLVGRDIMARLLHEDWIGYHNLGTIDFSHVGIAPLGLQVVLVPWMDGCVAVPELKER